MTMFDAGGTISSPAFFWLGIVLVFSIIVLVTLISPGLQKTRNNKDKEIQKNKR